MLKNYLKLAWRNLWKYKAYSLINICGLSLGLACCLLITLYLKDEWSFDRFHREADNLYQINYTWGKKENPSLLGRSPRYLGPVLDAQLPGVKSCIRFASRSAVVVRDKESFLEEVTYADPDFFSIFSFPLLQGNPGTVLNGTQSIVLTREMAQKYFGRADVVGKELELRMGNEPYRFVVSGVAANPPDNSSIRFGIVVSTAVYDRVRPPAEDYFRWTNPAYTTFLLLEPYADPATVADNINRITKDYPARSSKEYVGDALSESIFHYGLTPLKDIHLRRKTMEFDLQSLSRSKYGYILSLLAAGILLIACLNYVNLSLSQSLKRTSEIGIRKAMGGGKMQLIRQFGMENLLVIGVSLLLALCLVAAVLPWFGQLANKVLRIAYFADWRVALIVTALLLVIVVFTSLKPALYALRLKTVAALRNRHAASGNQLFPRSLVVVQFILALLLIAGCLVINLQSRFLQEKDLGYNDENLLTIALPFNMDGTSRALKNELRQHVRFESAALGSLSSNSAFQVKDGEVVSHAFNLSVDEDFLKTVQFALKAGRNFDSSDHHSNVLVNESFLKKFGIDHPIGRTVNSKDGFMFTIIGVVKDFQIDALYRMSPLILQNANARQGSGYDLFVRLPPGDISNDLSAIAAIFRRHFPYHPFDARFQRAINEQRYRAALRWQRIVNYSCGMAIFIACCGLLGLSLLSAQSRTKEIGIRKVLGASVSGIVALLSGNFIKPVFLAVLLATPLAWYIMHRWLEHFAYRIELRWWMFGLAGLLAVVMALLTVSLHSIKAALANPADSLGNE